MSEAELKPGTVIAEKFSIVEPIGVGGSATVYRARRVGMSQEVALKVMHSEHPDSDNEKIRFAREAELVMKLQHPHVVPLLDYGHTADDVPFLVFALLEGQSLERKLRNDGAMPWAQIGRLSVQVLKALEKAHSLGVVHRDIKPANIFLSTGVLGEVVQVLDFGLAKMVKEPDTELTQAGALLGTPRYMAPEQVRGETITHAADIYSCGLVMAEMLLGRPLVTGAKELDIYVAQGSYKPIFIPDEVLSTPFGNIVQRAVNKKVEVRYHMASQMLADVHAVLDNLQGPQEDVEADLDATRMIDPSAAAILSNPHAEKMRRVLNAAAKKKEVELAKAANKAASKAASAADAVAKAERPTHIPPKKDVPDVAIPASPPAQNLGLASAVPAQPQARAEVDGAGPSLGGLAATMPLTGSMEDALADARRAADAASGAGPASTPNTTSPGTEPRAAMGSAADLSPASSGPAGPTASAGQQPSAAAPGDLTASNTSLPAVSTSGTPSTPAAGQTGLKVALAAVSVLILAGVAAILWMLGLLPA